MNYFNKDCNIHRDFKVIMNTNRLFHKSNTNQQAIYITDVSLSKTAINKQKLKPRKSKLK